MDIDLAINLDPLSYLPVGLWAWTLQIVPAAFGIWTERSNRRLARGDYLLSLIGRILGLLVLNWIALAAVSALVFTHDPASRIPMLDGITALMTAVSIIAVISSIILIRPLVRRLRDAGIDKKWAYCAVLPYLDFLMFVGLIFVPRSKVPTETPATAPSQT